MNKDTKLYYSIGEVSQLTGLKPYVLRYWEKEFTNLRPEKNSAGNRTYRSRDIEIVNQIKELLYERRFTIEGARQYFRGETPESPVVGSPPEVTAEPSAQLQWLKDIRHGLDGILQVVKADQKTGAR